MTDAQWKVKVEQLTARTKWDNRAFRKKCVTQGIVTFNREDGGLVYTVRYRNRFISIITGDRSDKRALFVMWNVIRTAEETIKNIEGVKHESN